MTEAVMELPFNEVQAKEVDEQDDIAGVALPGYDETTEKSVIKGIRDVFKGFDPATSVGQFQNEDALAEYARNTITDINEMRKVSDATQLLHKAAAAARFWYLGQTIDSALKEGAYGSNVIKKLTDALGHSQTYIYEIRNVGIRLSLIDCYLLGMRGLERSDLRKLASVRDDNMRKKLVMAYVEAIKTSADKAKMESARKQLKNGLNAYKNTDAIDLESSDPNNGGTEIEVSPEWTEAMSVIRKWSKMMKPAGEDNTIFKSTAALGNFYLDASVPDAERRLAELKEAAEETALQLRAAKTGIDAILVELDSISGVELNS